MCMNVRNKETKMTELEYQQRKDAVRANDAYRNEIAKPKEEPKVTYSRMFAHAFFGAIAGVFGIVFYRYLPAKWAGFALTVSCVASVSFTYFVGTTPEALLTKMAFWAILGPIICLGRDPQ